MRLVVPLLFALGALALAPAGCAKELTVEGAPCPCEASLGFTCCSGTCQYYCDDPKKATVAADSEVVAENDVSSTATLATITGPATCVTADADAVYWVDATGHLGGVRINDGVPIKLGQFPLPASPTEHCSFARDADSLYVAFKDAAMVLQLSVAPKDGLIMVGETATRLGSFFLSPEAIAIDGGMAYVLDEDVAHRSGSIRRVSVPKNGVAATDAVTLTSTAAQPSSLIVDSASIYWTDLVGVQEMPKAGGDVTVIQKGADTNGLRLINGQPFWISGTTELLMLPTGAPRPLAVFLKESADESDRQLEVRDPLIPVAEPKGYSSRPLEVADVTGDATTIVMALANGNRIAVSMGYSGGPFSPLFYFTDSSSLDTMMPDLATNLFMTTAQYVWLTQSGSLRTLARTH
jgi:hypothetical protein